MGRLYTDFVTPNIFDRLLNDTDLQQSTLTIPLVEQSYQPQRQPLDQGGDTAMVNSLSPPISPFKDKFNFDWFSFNNDNKPPQAKPQPPVSPLSPFSEPHPTPDTRHPPSDILTTTRRPSAPPITYPPPPTKPLSWVWQCHMCRSRYPLSVTRRCLIDGHYYCSGDTKSNPQRNTKRRRKAQFCTSEFDYVGWQDWSQWRRKCMALQTLANGATRSANLVLRGCQGCSFPSQCRYENRPRVELVELEKYIDEDDLARIENELGGDEVGEIISLEKAALPNSPKSSGKENKAESIGGYKDKMKLQKKSTSLDTNAFSPNSNAISSSSSSKRQRFYSSVNTNLSANLSNPNLSPTSESSSSFSKSPGSFDPTLPSVTSKSNNTSNNTSSTPTDLPTFESTLKATLTSQKQKSISVPSSSPSSKKHRTNSKSHNPEFEITVPPSDLTNHHFHPNGGPLSRTTSHQILLSDFLRISKTAAPIPLVSDHRSSRPDTDARRAASEAKAEADIASFLQLKPGFDIASATSSQRNTGSVSSGGTRNRNRSRNNDFEDIALSPPPAPLNEQPASGTFSAFSAHLGLPSREELELDQKPIAAAADGAAAGAGASERLSFLGLGMGLDFRDRSKSVG